MLVRLTIFDRSNEQVVKWTGSITDAIFSGVQSTMSTFMEELRDRIRANVSGLILQPKTGELANSVQIVPITTKGRNIQYGGVSAGGPRAPYGIIHEKGGTHPYDIFAKNARVLAFEKGGKLVFATHVTHPPTPARPWFRPAVDEMRATFRERMNEVMATAIRGKGNS